MFIGEFRHLLDPKGRIAVPAKFRSKAGEGVVMTRGIDNCLFVFTRGEWEKLARKLVQLPLSQANSRAFARLMLSGATEGEPDAQGRILIPEFLRAYAGLKKRAVVVGVYNRFEVWDEEAWEKYRAKSEEGSQQIAEQLGELGI